MMTIVFFFSTYDHHLEDMKLGSSSSLGSNKSEPVIIVTARPPSFLHLKNPVTCISLISLAAFPQLPFQDIARLKVATYMADLLT